MARNTRQQGNKSENSVMEMAEALGYATFAARGSRGPVDVLCFVKQPPRNASPNTAWYTHDLVPLVIQVGTTNKPIASTLAELSAAPRPIGSLCLVARRHKKRKLLKNGTKGRALEVVWSYHSAAGSFATLAEAIEGRL